MNKQLLPNEYLYNSVLNAARLLSKEGLSQTEFFAKLNKKFGGILWDSGGNIQILTIILNYNHTITVSTESVCYNRIIQKNTYSFEELIYMQNEPEVLAYDELDKLDNIN